ncbi:MAG: hypothetical protein ACRDGD_10095 [Candidatus Limnocylindria bacterium]
MNRIAAALLGVTALVVIGFGIERIVYWVSLPLGPQFGAGEMFGSVVGVVILALGVGVGLAARAVWHDARGGWIAAGAWAVALGLLAYTALSTPGPAPVPVPLSIGAAVSAVVIGILVLARAAGRPARWWNT